MYSSIVSRCFSMEIRVRIADNIFETINGDRSGNVNKTRINLFLAGGSSLQSFPPERAPLAGWGQALALYFTDTVNIANYAISGRSSRSFVEEGRLEQIKETMEKGDYLIVHFGHNDVKKDHRYTEPSTTFKQYMTMYVDAARECGAIPILVTPVNKRKFDEAGNIVSSTDQYAEAVKQLGADLNVTVIDLERTSRALLQQLGPEWSQRLFLWAVPGEYGNYPDGKQDNSHFNELGARLMAELFAKELTETDLPLTIYMRNIA